MIKKAFIRANIPFTANDPSVFGADFSQAAAKQGWNKFEMQGDFFLRHISISLVENVICFSKQLDPINLLIPVENPNDSTKTHNYPLVINQAQIYFFDTGVGICTFHIPYDCNVDEDVVINSCSVLHCSAKQPDSRKSKFILRNGEQTYLSCIAEDILNSLVGSSYTLFGTQNEASQRRIDMFTAVLYDIGVHTDDAYDKKCYLLANAYDTRNDALTVVKKEDVFYQHDYTRWYFSKRGCAVASNLTGTAINDAFLNGRWFFSLESNYFWLYIMVLHQKLATYYYLNCITNNIDLDPLKVSQKTLIEFNSKYIFSIVSDEPFIQNAYSRMKQASNVDDVYAEFTVQLNHIFDYARVKFEEANEAKNHKLNLISTIVGVVCSLSVIIDSISLFSSHGCSLNFQTTGNCIFSGVVILEALLFLTLLIFLLFPNKKAKGS